MSDDFDWFSMPPNGFSSFIDMIKFQQSVPLLGINTMERRINIAEMNAYIEKKVAEFRRAETKADKVALELAIEEQLEKAKEVSKKEKKVRKSERKRRQRCRQKLRKEESSDKIIENSEEQEDEQKQEAEEEFDLNSAFVSNLAEKVINKKQIRKNNTSQNDRNERKNKILTSDEPHPVTELAIEGYNLAKEGCFNKAIDKFSEALYLNPNDYRLYVNRCLCFLQIGQYQKALEDSENCVKYAHDYSKGYFRMGEAYLGLNDFPSAEKAFEHVLKLDPNSEEAMNDLIFIKIKKLMEMGFSKEKATLAIQKVKSLTAALDYLLTNSNDSEGEENTNVSSQFKDTGECELFQSDEEDESFSSNQEQNAAAGFDDDYSEAASIISSIAVSDHAVPQKYSIDPCMDPTNPYHCTKLYIGDVSSRIKKKLLELTFSSFGDLISVIMLPSDRCAIITFRDWKSCGPAMEKLQNWSLLPGTPAISIKYPTSELQKLAGGSLPLNKNEHKLKSNFSINDDIHAERGDWCSQTMPPSSPAPSLSSVRSTYSQAVLRSPQRRTKVDPLRECDCKK
ncbi:uncharacterized protein LOC142334444 isoform X2 [Lycorma delicatula]|uniref:uncharacterized protein LOC142334444 isoform X2 n=1 Tax=Lycorma delicatula TaxID=130591 RepID=UPI003F518F52